MKKSKKLLALLLVVAMLICLFAACGSSSESASSSEEETTESAASEEAETASEESEAASEESAASEEPAEEETTEEASEETAAEEEAASESASGTISYPLEGDTNTISIWYYIPPYSGAYPEYAESNYSWLCLPYAQEATGVELTFVEAAYESVTELFNIMIASGDMCDLIPVNEYYSGGLSQAYEQEIIIDIEPYVEEYMPDYNALLSTQSQDVVDDTLVDGAMLAFYSIADGSTSGTGMLVRGDWMEEQGLSFSGDTISLDEFTELFYTLHDIYETPYTFYLYNSGTMDYMQSAFDTEFPLLSSSVTSVADATIFRYGDTVTSAWITDGYRDYLEWVIQCFDDGVMDSDFLSLSDDETDIHTARGTGQVAFWWASAAHMDDMDGYLDENNQDFLAVAVPRVVPNEGDQYVWEEEATLVSASFSISTSCKNPELVCQWENYFWTEEGNKLYNYGVDGLTYSETEDGIEWLDGYVYGENAYAPNADMGADLFTMTRFATGYKDHDKLLSTYSDIAKAAIDVWTLDDSTDDRNYPSLLEASFTVEENEAISEYESDVVTYAAENILKFLTGQTELNDDTWNEYVETVRGMGMDAIIEVYQNAYDEYLAGER